MEGYSKGTDLQDSELLNKEVSVKLVLLLEQEGEGGMFSFEGTCVWFMKE